MKKYFILIGGILLMMLGIGLWTIGVVTNVKIIRSGSVDGLDIALGVIMLVFVMVAVGMIFLGGKLIHNTRKEINLQYMMEKQENKKLQGDRNGKVWIYVGLLLAAVVCIGMLFVFQGQFAVMMISIFGGAACMLVFGTLRGIEFKRSGKWKGRPRQLQGVIGLPVMIYIAIVYSIIEYVVGW